MSYQVLARKWRPRNFCEMVGQEHVLKALINALDRNRLHHAYLFTGTRGVGKTTIARILAKCLNCELGITSSPCGECSACAEIGAGRFVDLIEVDAASRTRVEDTRELLDNVQYAPTRGRFKIYLIDEVHMLSTHSFNALLKTLEEPPEHVKFLLATTDPQKLPITILSRCLQFNLKNMSPERIVQHLKTVLDEEQLPYDESALWLLARSADGSMRDALSLTDQAIGYGSGKVAASDVSAMLGTIDHRLIESLLEGLADSDGRALLATIAEFSEQAPDYRTALADLLTALHRIAIAQTVPEALDNSYGDRDRILDFAGRLPAEDVQLFYQMALTGRRDLDLAPDPRAGFEMVLLRMLAFRPQGLVELPDGSLSEAAGRSGPADLTKAEMGQMSDQEADRTGKKSPTDGAAAGHEPAAQAHRVDPQNDGAPGGVPAAGEVQAAAVAPDVTPSHAPRQEVPAATRPPSPSPQKSEEAQGREQPGEAVVSLQALQPPDWPALYRSLKVRGVLQTTFGNCVLLSVEQDRLIFALDQSKASLYDDSHGHRLGELLSQYFGSRVKVDIKVQALADGALTPFLDAEQRRKQRHQEVLDRLGCDPVVQSLQHELGARLVPESIRLKQ